MKANETESEKPTSSDLFGKLDAWWRAANYLSVGQIYLSDNPLLKEPLKKDHLKRRLLGHWGTTPGLNFIYAHLNRVIRERDLSLICLVGPGHGAPGIVANTWLEGTYSKVYPDVGPDEDGMRKLFKQFSAPGGIPGHLAPETPGSIHEGSELGHTLSHAFGAAFDNPQLIVAAVVGDGEAETASLATSWHANKFLNPATDGAVLPILHLNGYKMASPSVLARISHEELVQLFRGYGYTPYFVEGSKPEEMHRLMAFTLDRAMNDLRRMQMDARQNGQLQRPRWPMIILRSPKGWTGPKEINGKRTEDSWRAHHVPLAEVHEKPEQVKQLEKWLKSYRPEELFNPDGGFKPELAELAPHGERRMSANPHANGGLLLRNLGLPDFRPYAVDVRKPGGAEAEATRVMGKFLSEVMKLNLDRKNFRVFSPDENNANRWQDVLEVTARAWLADRFDHDDRLAPNGRVLEMLSEQTCQGWLEGYLLTSRHGFFTGGEAFISIIDSMLHQHAKWLQGCQRLSWRRPIASLNYLLASQLWRQDPNGFSHQDPGFIDHVVNQAAEVVRVYLPPDANCLLAVTDQCLRSRNLVNVIIASKDPSPQWLPMDQAVKHCAAGLGIWDWASNDRGHEPDVVMACCGDVPTLETLAAVDLLHRHLPELKVRVINVVDLLKLQPPSEHTHGLSDPDFEIFFTKDKPIIFAFHGYPWLIDRLISRRANHRQFHVRGYQSAGATTTPFDMCVQNELDRFHLAQAVINSLPQLGARAAYAKQTLRDALHDHQRYLAEHGEDDPKLLSWKWSGPPPASDKEHTAESDHG